MYELSEIVWGVVGQLCCVYALYWLVLDKMLFVGVELSGAEEEDVVWLESFFEECAYHCVVGDALFDADGFDVEVGVDPADLEIGIGLFELVEEREADGVVASEADDRFSISEEFSAEFCDVGLAFLEVEFVGEAFVCVNFVGQVHAVEDFVWSAECAFPVGVPDTNV